MSKFFEELKRRNVIKSALAYLVVSWVITQVATTVLPTFGAPVFVAKTIIFILAIGFPLWLIFSWVYEITDGGIKKTVSIDPEKSITPQTNNRLNKIIIGALVIAIALLLVNQFGSKEGNNIVSENIIDKTEKSIAVLAFTDMSENKDQEYLSDGMSAELISLLGKNKELKVRDRRSSFTFKGKNATIEEIGTQLKVTHVIDGSVRKFGNQLRVNVEIIDILDSSNNWRESFDYNMDNIFKMQDDIAQLISRQLKMSLGIEDKISKRGTYSIEAYENMLKGRHIHMNEMLLDANSDFSEKIQGLFYKSEMFFLKAIELDSTYAEAHAELANLYDSGYHWVFPKDSTFNKKAENEIDIAYRLNPKSGRVNYNKGIIYQSQNNQDKAIEYFLNSIELNPEDAYESYNEIASKLLSNGLYNEARLIFIKSLQYNPIEQYSIRRKGFANQIMGRFDAAEEDYQESLLLGDEYSLFMLSRLYCLKKDIIKAENYFEMFLKSDEYSKRRENNLKAYILAAKGDQKALDLLRSQEILLILGNYDEWFDYMEAFFDKNLERSYYHQLTIDPNKTEGIHQAYLDLFVPLRKHPRYPAMLESQKKRYEDNVKRFSLKNSILKDM